MDQPQSVRPAGVSRPARRSLTEFALPATGVVEDVPAAAEPPLPTGQSASTTQRDAQPSIPIDDEGHHVVRTPVNEDHHLAANELAQANDLKSADVEDDPLLHQFEDMTLAAAEAAKDYRFLMLEHLKINMAAALSCVNGFASVNSQIASAAHPDASERETSPHPESVEEAVPTEEEVADEYRVKAFELMTANMNTTLEYAQRLAHVKTPSELVELATSQARKQFDLMVQQTSELGSIAQRLAPHDIAAVAVGFAKLLSERKE
jgi:hypothetical protein